MAGSSTPFSFSRLLMHIVHVAEYFNERLGYQECNLAREHARQHRVSVITSERVFPFPNYNESYGRLLGPRTLEAGIHRSEDGFTVHRLRTRMELPSSATIYYGPIGRTLGGLRPDFIVLHEVSKPHLLPVLGYVKRRPTTKLVVDSHAAGYNTKIDSFLKRAYVRFWRTCIIRRHYHRFDKIVVTGPAEFLWAKKHMFVGLDARMTIVPLGANTERFRPDPSLKRAMRQRFKIPDDDLVIVTAGKVSRQKASWELLQVFSRLCEKHENIRLLYVGGGDQKLISAMKAKVAREAMHGRVLFVDFVANEDLTKYLNIGDIGCWPGTRSNVFWEGLACGLPLVLRDEVFTRALVGNENGTVVHDTGQHLYRSLDEMLQNRSRLRAMGKKSRQLAEEKYSWGRVAQSYLEVDADGAYHNPHS